MLMYIYYIQVQAVFEEQRSISTEFWGSWLCAWTKEKKTDIRNRKNGTRVLLYDNHHGLSLTDFCSASWHFVHLIPKMNRVLQWMGSKQWLVIKASKTISLQNSVLPKERQWCQYKLTELESNVQNRQWMVWRWKRKRWMKREPGREFKRKRLSITDSSYTVAQTGFIIYCNTEYTINYSIKLWWLWRVKFCNREVIVRES